MHEPTNRDILTAVEALARDLHLFRDVTESRFGIIGQRFDSMDERFDRTDLTLAQHSLALTELSADGKEIRTTLADHGRKLDRREKRR